LNAAPRERRRVAGLAAAVLILGALAVLADWKEVRIALEHSRFGPVSFALLFTAVSYLAIAYGFASIGKLFGLRVSRRDLVLVGFASSAMSNLVALGGAAGYSLRVSVLNRRGIPAAEVLGPSLFHSYLNTMFLVALLPVGLGILLKRHPLSPRAELEIGAVLVLLVMFLVLGALLLCLRAFRVAVLRRIEAVWRRLSRKDATRVFRELDETLTRGIAAAARRPTTLLLPVTLVVVDWAACVVAVGFCFDALGSHVTPGVLLTGFAVGVAAGLVSMIPGGLGVQEGSMAGIYALLGIPFEQALLASILFRVVYYFVPYFASLGLYRSMLRRA
jgi:uncharacterized protein (TIRG00374 family)